MPLDNIKDIIQSSTKQMSNPALGQKELNLGSLSSGGGVSVPQQVSNTISNIPSYQPPAPQAAPPPPPPPPPPPQPQQPAPAPVNPYQQMYDVQQEAQQAMRGNELNMIGL